MWQDATFSTLVGRLLEIVSIFVLVVFALALLVIIWKIISAWVLNAGDEGKREEGKKTVVFAFVVLVVMASVWGIVALLGNGLGLTNVSNNTSSSGFSNSSNSNSSSNNDDPWGGLGSFGEGTQNINRKSTADFSKNFWSGGSFGEGANNPPENGLRSIFDGFGRGR